MPAIKCSVSECKWNKAVQCQAPMIQVNHNGVNSSMASQETQCDTFKPKI